MVSDNRSILDAVSSGKERNHLTIKRSAFFGMFAVLFFSTCWILGIIIDGDWVWNEDVICRLGISDVPFVANMYLVSCVTTGTCLAICGYGFMRDSPRMLEKFAFFACIIFGLSMIGLGLIDMNDKEHHRIFSTAIMLFGIVTILSDSIEDFIFKRLYIAIPTLIFGISVVIILFVDSDAVQTFSVAGMLIWLFARCALKVWVDERI